MTHTMRKTSKLILTGILAIGLIAPAFSAQATDSAHMQLANQKPAVPQKNESYVDNNANSCVELKSTPYVIAFGAGGTNMNLKCPNDKPVMTRWHQELGFGPSIFPPLPAVSEGGGDSSIYCCPMKSHWVPSKQA